MSDTTPDLRCPECDGPITVEELAADGVCRKCTRRAVRDIPKPTQQTSDGPELPESGASDPHASPGLEVVDQPSQEALDAFAELIGGTAAIFTMSEQLSKGLYKVDGDDVCQAFGAWLDYVRIGAGELLDGFAPGWSEADTVTE